MTHIERTTILLVDDEDLVRGVTRRMLELPECYDIMEAATCEHALGIAREYAGDIHLLISDVQMPGMNGAELAAEIIRLRPGIRVLLISGHVADIRIDHPLLDKPFSIETLLNTIARITRNGITPGSSHVDQNQDRHGPPSP